MITETIADLQNRGFTADFTLINNRLFCAQTQQFFDSGEFDVIEVHNIYETPSDTQSIILYGIECFQNAVKGILFNAAPRSKPPDILLHKIRKFWK